jgi:hypothetical protein
LPSCHWRPTWAWASRWSTCCAKAGTTNRALASLFAANHALIDAAAPGAAEGGGADGPGGQGAGPA